MLVSPKSYMSLVSFRTGTFFLFCFLEAKVIFTPETVDQKNIRKTEKSVSKTKRQTDDGERSLIDFSISPFTK